MCELKSFFYFLLIAGAVLSLFLGGCEKKRLNPLDPESSAFEAPGLAFVSAPDNYAVLTADSVEFAWTGNSPVNIYSYSLTNVVTGDVYYISSGWVSDSSAVFSHLDDGAYRFEITARYIGLDTATKYEKSFSVRTENAPAMVFVRKYTTQPAGGLFEIDVCGEGLLQFMAGDISLSYDPGVFSLVGVADGNLKDSSNVSQYTLFAYGGTDPVTAANKDGTLNLSTMFLAKSSGGNAAVGGTGSIIRLIFKARSVGVSSLSFIYADLRDANGDSLAFRTAGPATVNVTEGK